MSFFDEPKKNAIVPVHESGRGYSEGDAKEEYVKWYKIICPRCKAQVGFPCYEDKRGIVDYRTICIARVVAYEAFEISGKSWGKE